MVYGYNVIEPQTIGHGCAWWDEYYETTEFKVIETKLFSSKEEFDERIKELKEKYYYRLGDEIHIIEFETEDDLRCGD